MNTKLCSEKSFFPSPKDTFYFQNQNSVNDLQNHFILPSNIFQKWFVKPEESFWQNYHKRFGIPLIILPLFCGTKLRGDLALLFLCYPAIHFSPFKLLREILIHLPSRLIITGILWGRLGWKIIASNMNWWPSWVNRNSNLYPSLAVLSTLPHWLFPK